MFRAVPAQSCHVGDRFEVRRYGPAISYGQTCHLPRSKFSHRGKTFGHRIAIGVAFRNFAPRQ
jgi:hypothetical protein